MGITKSLPFKVLKGKRITRHWEINDFMQNVLI